MLCLTTQGVIFAAPVARVADNDLDKAVKLYTNVSKASAIRSVAEPPHSWAAPAPEVRVRPNCVGSRRLRLHTLKFVILSS